MAAEQTSQPVQPMQPLQSIALSKLIKLALGRPYLKAAEEFIKTYQSRTADEDSEKSEVPSAYRERYLDDYKFMLDYVGNIGFMKPSHMDIMMKVANRIEQTNDQCTNCMVKMSMTNDTIHYLTCCVRCSVPVCGSCVMATASVTGLCISCLEPLSVLTFSNDTNYIREKNSKELQRLQALYLKPVVYAEDLIDDHEDL